MPTSMYAFFLSTHMVFLVCWGWPPELNALIYPGVSTGV